jgi:hypothetical protein
VCCCDLAAARLTNLLKLLGRLASKVTASAAHVPGSVSHASQEGFVVHGTPLFALGK